MEINKFSSVQQVTEAIDQERSEQEEKHSPVNEEEKNQGEGRKSTVAFPELNSSRQNIESAHTSTPWRIKNSSSPVAHERVRILGADGESVASSAAYRSAGEAEANAEFICQAVNAHEALYSALKAIEKQFHKGVVVHTKLPECPGCIARAALAISEKGNKDPDQDQG